MKYFLSFSLALLITSLSFGQDYFLFTGTYTNGESKGIYIYKFNGKTGTITPKINNNRRREPFLSCDFRKWQICLCRK